MKHILLAFCLLFTFAAAQAQGDINAQPAIVEATAHQQPNPTLEEHVYLDENTEQELQAIAQEAPTGAAAVQEQQQARLEIFLQDQKELWLKENQPQAPTTDVQPQASTAQTQAGVQPQASTAQAQAGVQPQASTAQAQAGVQPQASTAQAQAGVQPQASTAQASSEQAPVVTAPQKPTAQAKPDGKKANKVTTVKKATKQIAMPNVQQAGANNNQIPNIEQAQNQGETLTQEIQETVTEVNNELQDIERPQANWPRFAWGFVFFIVLCAGVFFLSKYQ